MKIIDLLNKIANGEEVPKKFIIKGSCSKDLYFEYNKKYNCYDLIGENFKNGCYVFGYGELNDEVEILDDEAEEKGLPEKLPYYSLEKIQKAKNKDEWYEERVSLLEKRVEDLHIKMNDLIDYLEKQRKGE